MKRSTLVRIAAVIGIVLSLMLAGGAPHDYGIRGVTTLVSGGK